MCVSILTFCTYFLFSIFSALSISFDMYELKNSGDWVGKQRKLTRRTEKGETVPYVDAYYDYAIEVRHLRKTTTCASTAIVRRDIDPVTLDESGRRLINLKTSNHPVSREIVRLLTQIESLSHILAWSDSCEVYEDAFASNALVPSLIDCPRLRVKFSISYDPSSEAICLYVVDSGGKYVMTNQDEGVNPQLLAGIPARLLLGRSSGNIYIMVPNCPMYRQKIAFCPFTTSTQMHMDDYVWQDACNARYYLYEVHPSDTFVTFTSIGSTLYWAFLKLLHREYTDAYTAIVSCGTDMKMRWSEYIMLTYFKRCEGDYHPDCHACLLKLRLALQHSPISTWPVIPDNDGDSTPFCENYSAYITKRNHVSLACRLTLEEEILIMDYFDENIEEIGIATFALPDKTCDALIGTRRNIISACGVDSNQKGETKTSNTYTAYHCSAKNGGVTYQKFLNGLLKTKPEYQKFLTSKTHWIGQCTVHKKSANSNLLKAASLKLIDQLWDMKLNEGSFTILQAMMAGNVKIDITGFTGSSLKQLKSRQYLAHMITRQREFKQDSSTAALDLIIATASQWQTKSSLCGKLKSLNTLTGSRFQTYVSSRDTGKENFCKWRNDYLLPHAKLLKQNLVTSNMNPSTHMSGGQVFNRSSNQVVPYAKSVVSGTTNYARPMTTLKVVSDNGAASISQEDVNAFMKQPLSQFVNFDEYITCQPMPHDELCPDSPPYDLSGHVDAETVVAKNTRKRVDDDCKVYAKSVNSKQATVFVKITPELMDEYEKEQNENGVGNVTPSFGPSAIDRLSSLKDILTAALAKDTKRMRDSTAYLIQSANQVPSSTSKDVLQYRLQQNSGHRARMNLTHLVACIVSSKSEEDVKSFNPYAKKIDNLLSGTAGVIMVANRISQLRRTMGAIGDVTKAINRKIDAKKMRKEIDGLVGNLLATRHYSKNGNSYDPRFLMFEYLTGFLLRKSQVYLTEVFMERAVNGGQNEW